MSPRGYLRDSLDFASAAPRYARHEHGSPNRTGHYTSVMLSASRMPLWSRRVWSAMAASSRLWVA